MTLPLLDPAQPSPLHAPLADTVHYVLCAADAAPGSRREADFLAAVSRARTLVMSGARRIVFLIAGDATDGALQRSLAQFARHVGRTMPSRQIEFAVMPLHGTPRLH